MFDSLYDSKSFNFMEKKDCYRIIGLMSGTSLDGLDLVCVLFTKSAQHWHYTIEHAESISYNTEWQSKLKNSYYLSGELLIALDSEYGRLLGKMVKEFAVKYSITNIDFVASHGHTVFHRPDLGYNLQIGNGAHLHAVSELKVICDFRTLDIAFGGQGAPLVPIGDKLLFGKYDYCLNIGGFANISFDNSEGKRIAYDLCPANYVLNRLMRTQGKEYDNNGETARSGNVNQRLFNMLNALEYYHLKPPKSLAQEWVDSNIMPLINNWQDNFKNIVATMTEHSAYQIGKIFKSNCKVLVTGGGTYNTYLLERALTYGNFEWIIPDKKIIEFKEALIFAFLGLRRAIGYPNCLKSVTGATHDVISGNCFGF